jgi:hypothetical protein
MTRTGAGSGVRLGERALGDSVSPVLESERPETSAAVGVGTGEGTGMTSILESGGPGLDSAGAGAGTSEDSGLVITGGAIDADADARVSEARSRSRESGSVLETVAG